MSMDTLVFISASTIGMLTFLTIFVFRHLMKMGRHIRRSVFVTTVTMLAAIGGLAMGLAFDAGHWLVIVFPLSIGTMGLMAAVGASLILYRRK